MKTDAELESLLRAFEDCTLPSAEWTHQQHLTVALAYLHRYPRGEATRRIGAGIRKYNLSRGNPTGYHETVTLAWVAVISRFLDDHGRDQPLPALIEALLEGVGEKDYLLQFYSRDRLMSPEARRDWVAPDLRPIE